MLPLKLVWSTSNQTLCHSTCQSNPFEVNKAVVVARLMSGRYPSDWHCRHWSPDNKKGSCLLCPDENLPGTIEHLLVSCISLADKREQLIKYMLDQSEDSPQLLSLLNQMFGAPVEELVQFLLDPSVVPLVVQGCQQEHFSLKQVFRLTRTFCYGMHRRRQQMLGRFNPAWKLYMMLEFCYCLNL